MAVRTWPCPRCGLPSRRGPCAYCEAEDRDREIEGIEGIEGGERLAEALAGGRGHTGEPAQDPEPGPGPPAKRPWLPSVAEAIHR